MDPKIYRPICLLNEAGKIFERVIVDRLNNYLRDSNSLSKDQYDFRRGYSTVDAISRRPGLWKELKEVGWLWQLA